VWKGTPWRPILRRVTTELEPSLAILARAPGGSFEALPVDRLDDLDGIAAREDALLWVHAFRPTSATVGRLGAEFGIHPLALEDLQKRRQRPKLDVYEGQVHLVAYEASPAAAAGLAELQILVGRRWILSVHWEPTSLTDALHARLLRGSPQVPSTVSDVAYHILDAATDSYFPELDRLSERIDALEDEVIEQRFRPAALGEVLGIKRGLLEQRRVLASMRDVANALLRGDGELVDQRTFPYYQDLYDHLVRVLDQLDLYRDLLAAVLDARTAAIGNELNATVRRLTALTVVIMVPTLIAGIYGMNFAFMPELGWPWGYPFALGLMALVVVTGVAYFRSKGWL